MRVLDNVNIGPKLAVAFGSLAAITLGVSVFGYIRLSSIETTNS